MPMGIIGFPTKNVWFLSKKAGLRLKEKKEKEKKGKKGVTLLLLGVLLLSLLPHLFQSLL